MERVYKERWLIDLISTTVAKSKITNQYLVEERIYSQLVIYFDKFPDARNHRSKLRNIVYNALNSALSDTGYRKEESLTFDDYTESSKDFDESVEFEPKDNRANVFDVVAAREDVKKIVSLATDDRKLVALNGLMVEDTVTQISETLARRFGGKSESHRKFVTRFKAECCNAINADM